MSLSSAKVAEWLLGRVSPKEYRVQPLATDHWGFTPCIWILLLSSPHLHCIYLMHQIALGINPCYFHGLSLCADWECYQNHPLQNKASCSVVIAGLGPVHIILHSEKNVPVWCRALKSHCYQWKEACRGWISTGIDQCSSFEELALSTLPDCAL